MTEAQLRIDGMKALNDRLGIVEAERFISVLLREKFDYTEWRQILWGNITLPKGRQGPSYAKDISRDGKTSGQNA